MEYFYAPPSHITMPTLRIEGEEFVHLSHVMRKKENDTICVVDGCGNLYEAAITRITGRAAFCTVTSHTTGVNEPLRQAILGVGILKHGANFDFLVEKATELGVHTIVPLFTERTIPTHAKPDRWRKLALAAMKQSRRCFLPLIGPLTFLADFLRSSDRAAVCLIAHEKTEHLLLRDSIPRDASRVVLVIGPEGGFSEGEIVLAKEEGFVPVGLGPRRLRTETAAIVAVAQALM